MSKLDQHIDPNTQAARWDQRYGADQDSWVFGRRPSCMAQQAASLWEELWPGERPEVLDLGCGEGRDSVWFASRGWRVTAVDISTVGLQKASRLAMEQDVTITALIHSDILQFEPNPVYNLVFAGSSLHGLGDACIPYLRKLQEVAAIGSLHAIRLMSTAAEGPEDTGNMYRVEPGELLDLYEGWRILDTSENRICILRTGRNHSFSELIAQKV